uniref:Uncharacterized protein n=1 Tax=Cuerna arida TaxID=1464854 RepID=A0A1B6FJ32_9HEMI
MEDDEAYEFSHLCFSPNKDELRFIPDCDLISSGDTDSENDNCIRKPQKFNQLHPRGHIVFKLLNSVRTQFENTWEEATFRDDIVSVIPSFDLVNSMDSYIDPTSKMVQSNRKRRRGDALSDEELSDRQDKRVKRHSDDWKYKQVNRQEQAHAMSASESESSDEHLLDKKQSSERLNGYNTDHKNTNICNGHFSNNEDNSLSEQEVDLDMKHSNVSNNIDEDAHVSNQIDSEEEVESSEDTNSDNNRFIEPSPPGKQSRIKSNLKPVLENQNINTVQEKFYRTPKITEEDEEEISQFSSLLSESLLEKNNVWILQCPAQMDCSGLVNQCLDLNGSCQLAVGDTVFEAYSYKDRQDRLATLAVPSESNNFQLRQVPIAGNIIVEEAIQFNSKANFNIPEPPSYVELPENLRTRHPLLGLDYEKQPRTAPRLRSSPKKKKKRHEKKEICDLQDNLLEYPEETKIKKKKKKKHHSDDSN